MERKGNNIAEDTFLYWMDVERYMAEFKEGNFNNYEECQTVLRHLALREMAEAEGECEEGKRLVIDTILNRVDSASFPNTVYEVVYQPSQFSSMWNGRVNRCYIDDYICQLVVEELRNRKNYDVIFFTADRYGNYGTPMFQIGNHYFSSGE